MSRDRGRDSQSGIGRGESGTALGAQFLSAGAVARLVSGDLTVLSVKPVMARYPCGCSRRSSLFEALVPPWKWGGLTTMLHLVSRQSRKKLEAITNHDITKEP
jgi:hypothetical protein